MLYPEEAPPAVLSIEDSVQRLKTEILSVDWRISQKRADLLEAAFRCLKQRFKSRKSVFAIIVMANNVLTYIRKKGERRVPATVDFLKEAMAHIVTFYEDPRLDPDNDKKIFKSIYRRFTLLKEKIHHAQQLEQDSDAGSTPVALPEEQSPEQILQEAAAHSLSLQKPGGAGSMDKEMPTPVEQASLAEVALDEQREMDKETVEALVRELKDSLSKAEELGTTIRRLLVELLSTQQLTLPAMDGFLQRSMAVPSSNMVGERAPSPSPATRPLPAGKPTPKGEPQKDFWTPCGRTELLLPVLGEQQVAVEISSVAARKTIREARLPTYLKTSAVPLKDFGGFLQNLAEQFNGCLATLKKSNLRNLSLPLLNPRGINLPDRPVETAKEMLVLCNGNWCGILFCSSVNSGEATMIANRQINDGDLWKMALTEDGREVPLLNGIELLKREGNMILA